MITDLRRAPGYALLTGAVGIVLLMLLWLATSGAQGGGVVLGLLLTFVLASTSAKVAAQRTRASA